MNGDASPSLPHDFAATLAELVDIGLNPEEMDQFLHAMRQPGAVDAYVDYWAVHTLLEQRLAPTSDVMGLVESGPSAAHESTLDSLSDLPVVQRSTSSSVGAQPSTPAPAAPRLTSFIDLSGLTNHASPRLLATIVLVGLGSYFGFLLAGVVWDRMHTSKLEPAAQIASASANTGIARLISVHDCQWDSPSTVPRVGHALSGQPLKLIAGLAEIQFGNGASVVLEGPTDFTPQTAQRGLLAHGRLLAQVPNQARGFTVDTPTAEVVDLGTEFGIEVDQRGETSLHVIRGEVQVKLTAESSIAARAAMSQKLATGQAVLISAGAQATAPIPVDLARFEKARAARTLPESAGTISSLQFPAGQPIWLSNLFDDRPHTSLTKAMQTDTFRAVADFNDLGVDRVLYGGEPVKEIAPGLRFDLTNLGWTSNGGGHAVSNDSWTHVVSEIDGGGIRLRGQKMSSTQPRVEEGIGAHANALVTFNLDDIRAAGQLLNQPLEFICDRAGINDASFGGPGSIHLAVLVSTQDDVRTASVDGKPAKLARQGDLWFVASDSGEPLHSDGRFVTFQIPIESHSKYLTLISTSADDDSTGDAVVWIGARLEVAR